jgi:N-acetylglutamate synthase-like GNAT family acetyltransferase
MRWCNDEEIAAQLQLPEGYSNERIRRDDVPALVKSLTDWYPDIAVGVGSAYLRQDFYDTKVSFNGEEERDIAVWIFRHLGKVVGMWSGERIRESLSIYGRLIVIAPEHRHSKLAGCVFNSSKARALAQGAEYLFGSATLKHPYTQLAFEHAGFQLVGIAPGADREVTSDGVVKRVYEAVYAMTLVPEDGHVIPESRNLSPRTKALFDLLFVNSGTGNAA